MPTFRVTDADLDRQVDAVPCLVFDNSCGVKVRVGMTVFADASRFRINFDLDGGNTYVPIDWHRVCEFEHVDENDVRTRVPLYIPGHHTRKTVETFRKDIEEQLEERRDD
jgi:hypothetical protein